MTTGNCALYEIARRKLEEEFPGTVAKRPTSLLWKVFHPQLVNALAIPGVLAYVVDRPVVTFADLESARDIAIEIDVVPTGRIIIFAHKDALVEPEVTQELQPGKEEIRLLIGCTPH